MEVQILTRKVVKPSIPTPHSLRNYKLSFLDKLVSPVHFGILFFFFVVPSGKFSAFEIFAQLEKSLSETLTKFYPLAGRRHIKGSSLVHCNDGGVQVSLAEVHGHVAEIVHQQRPQSADLLDTLVPNPVDMAKSVARPILAVQINVFDCGGIAMGIRILHNIGDGVSLMTFITEWATANQKVLHQTTETSSYFPSFELSSFFPPRNLVGLKPLPEFPQPKKLVTKRFIFDAATISALKAEAANPSSPKP